VGANDSARRSSMRSSDRVRGGLGSMSGVTLDQARRGNEISAMYSRKSTDQGGVATSISRSHGRSITRTHTLPRCRNDSVRPRVRGCCAQTARHLDRTQPTEEWGWPSPMFGSPWSNGLCTDAVPWNSADRETTTVSISRRMATLPTLSAGLNRGDTDLWLFLGDTSGFRLGCSIG